MSVVVPVEAEKISKNTGKIVEFRDRQEAAWRNDITRYTQAIDPKFTVEHATPSATQPLPVTPALERVQAIRPDAEPMVDMVDTVGKAAGHLVQVVSREEGPLVHVETAPGLRAISFIRARMKGKKAA